MKSSGSERLQDHQRDDERNECDSPEYVAGASPVRRGKGSRSVIRVLQLQNSEERDWRTSPSAFESRTLIAMTSSRPELKAAWRGSSAFATASSVRAAR